MDKIVVCASQRQENLSILCVRAKKKSDIKNNKTYARLCIAIGAFKSGTIENMYVIVDGPAIRV